MAMVAPVAGVAARGLAARGAAGAAAKKGAGAAAKKSAVRTQVAKASSPITDGMTAQQVNDELQHRRSVAASVAKDEAAAKDAAAAAEESSADGASSSGSDERSSGRSLPTINVSTKGGAGGGFVLGMLVYVVGLTYLRDGRPGVQRLLRAKFFNKVGPA